MKRLNVNIMEKIKKGEIEMITVFVRIPVYDDLGYGDRDPEEIAEDIVDKIKKAGFPGAELDDIL